MNNFFGDTKKAFTFAPSKTKEIFDDVLQKNYLFAGVAQLARAADL